MSSRYRTGTVTQRDLSASPSITGTVPASIVASGSFTSSLIASNGCTAIGLGVLSTQAGTLSIQRYIDTAGLVPQGAAISVTLSASVAGSVNANDDAPHQSFKFTITNSSGTTAATISNFGLLLNAA